VTVGRLGEEGLLRRLLPGLAAGLSRRVSVGPGDDAAVVRAPGGRGAWVVTTDMLVEDVHFRRRWTTGEDLGYKAVAVNLSDLAAMGPVTPSHGVVSLGITPETPVDFVDSLYRGLRKAASEHRFDLVGGDTVRAPQTVISVTAVGWVEDRAAVVLRSGARAGDVLLVTGTLGDAAAGLDVLEKGRGRVPAWAARRLADRFRRPRPRLDAARRWRRGPRPTSLTDSSDGLWKSVRLLCDASGAGAEVHADRLPVSPALAAWAAARRRPAAVAALVGGEDYELVFTARPADARRWAAAGWARPVGTVVPRRRGIRVYDKGKVRHVPNSYEHFV
jgi:thiamine-monophosphate kinase